VNYLDRVQPELAQDFSGASCNLASDSLDAVFDNHSPRPNSGTGRFEGNGCGERQTIRATRTGDQDEVAGNYAGGIPAFAHRTANIGDGRCQAWAVSQVGLFSVIFM
jgi:hypothetical protein